MDESFGERRIDRWKGRMDMKKRIICVLGLAAVCLGGAAAVMKRKWTMSISLIGGADGPTSVFIAGKFGDGVIMGVLIGGILILAALGLIFGGRKRIHKKRKRNQ